MTITPPVPRDAAYNFAYLDEQTKRMIRGPS
jgi:alpha-D-ribose 1-methylphosphonate 5-phosphate C-P lyase